MKTNPHRLAGFVLAGAMAGGGLFAQPVPDNGPSPPSGNESGSKPVASLPDSATAILGTWANKAYDDQQRSGRVTYTRSSEDAIRYVATDMSDGTGKRYPGSVVFHEQWTGDDGYRHAVSTVTLDAGFAWKTLSRISPDGKTLEVQSGVEKINPNGPRYSVYYRQDG